MTVFPNQGRWDTSNVEYSHGRIVAYSKNNRTEHMRHIDYGLSVMSAAVLESVPVDRPTDLSTIFQGLVASGELAATEVSQRFYEVGSFAGLEEFRHYLRGARVDGICA